MTQDQLHCIYYESSKDNTTSYCHSSNRLNQFMRHKLLKFNGQLGLDNANQRIQDIEKIFDVI